MLYLSPNNKYPRHYGDIMNAHKGWKLGDPLPKGWREVAFVEPPVAEGDFVADELEPVEIDGVLRQQWTIRPMTQEEIDFRDASKIARQKLVDAGLTESEIDALLWTAGR